MLQEGIASQLENIINKMYVTTTDEICFEDPTRNLIVLIKLKPGAMMNFEFAHTVKDKTISFRTEDFPIYVYHNSIARLTPILNQLLFLENHTEYANHSLLMQFAATVSNVSLMLGDQSLIKTENAISELIPQQHRNEFIIVCGPIGEFMVCTVHFVKYLRDTDERSDGPTFWRPFQIDTVFSHLGKQYTVLDSVSKKTKIKTQSTLIAQLKALQMLLTSISTNLAVEEEENEQENE